MSDILVLNDLLNQVGKAVDNHPRLSRKRSSDGWCAVPWFKYTGISWAVGCWLRNPEYYITMDAETPTVYRSAEEAINGFLSRLDGFADQLSIDKHRCVIKVRV